MTYEPVDVIEVRCWGEQVGAVALDPSSGFYVFEYAPGWVGSGIELAPTTMPLREAGRPFVFPLLPHDTYYRLPAMIADALPDDFGNALTTAYLANEGVRPDQITPLDRLAYLGSRGVGALEFRPRRGPRTTKSTALELSELVGGARRAVVGDITREDGLTDALSHLIAVGTSAGGARAKAVVALNSDTGELRTGQVPTDPGFEPWLLKFDGLGADDDLGPAAPFGRIEYGYHLMAKAAGIDMTDCRLLEEGGRAHFMTRRFDRTPDGQRIHTQTLCAMAHLDFRLVGAHDYAQLFLQADALGLGPDVRAQIFRRLVFNVAAANCDDHTKNFSFMLSKGGAWRLSPAYDITHAHAPNSRWTKQHLMAVNGHTTDVTRADIDDVGDRFAVPSTATVIEDVLSAAAEWNGFADAAGVPEPSAEQVANDIENWSAPLR